MTRASNIKPALPEWLWDGYIPRGEITVLVGDGGTGKSTLAAALAAQLSTGELTGKPQVSLLALQEDDEAAVTVPRLMAAGADLNLVHVEATPGWRFPRDLQRLDDRITREGATMVVLDLLDSAVPALASQSARAILDDLAAIARRRNAAVILVHHLIKSRGTVAHRVGGGRAVWAVPRSILVLTRLDEIARLMMGLPDDADLVVLDHHKSSYGQLGESLLYERITHPHPAGGVQTVATLVQSVEIPDSLDAELLGSGRSRGWRRRVARTLIERFLLRGPCTGEDLQSDVCVIEEISRETFERARSELVAEGVIEHYQQQGRHWWRLHVPRLADIP